MTRTQKQLPRTFKRISSTESQISIGADAYRVREVGSDFGRAFRWRKVAGKARVGAEYSCCVAGDGQQHCDCTAGLRWQTCRHVEAVRDAIAKGLIEGGYPAATEEAASDEWAAC